MADKLKAEIAVSMTPARARAFLEALLKPKERSRLKRSPAKFLAEYGITLDPGAIPKPIELPTIDELKAFYSLSGALAPTIRPFAYCYAEIRPPTIRPMATCFVWSSAFIAVSAGTPKPKPAKPKA